MAIYLYPIQPFPWDQTHLKDHIGTSLAMNHDLKAYQSCTDRLNFKHWRLADIVKASDFMIVRSLVAVGWVNSHFSLKTKSICINLKKKDGSWENAWWNWKAGDGLMVEAFLLLHTTLVPRNQKVQFFWIQEKSRCQMQSCRGRRHATMQVLVGGSEIRSSCTCCDGWVFRVVGIAAVNGPLWLLSFFTWRYICKQDAFVIYSISITKSQNIHHILGSFFWNVSMNAKKIQRRDELL